MATALGETMDESGDATQTGEIQGSGDTTMEQEPLGPSQDQQQVCTVPLSKNVNV